MIYLLSTQTAIESSDNYYTTCTIDFCLQYISSIPVVGLDIETTRKYNKYFDIEGLDPYTSDIVMLQVGDIENQFIIDTRSVDAKTVMELIVANNKQIVGHNLSFEYGHILHKYGIRLSNIYDTMIAEIICTNGLLTGKGSYSLEGLILRYFEDQVGKSTRLQFLGIGSKPFTTTQILYGADDITYPLKIKTLQETRLKELDLVNVAKLEFRFLPTKAHIEYMGIGFDKALWIDVYKKNLEKLNKAKTKLDAFIATNYFDTKFIDKQLDLFSTDFKCNISWSSSKQVVEFFKYLEICPMAVSKTTKKMTYTVEAKEVKMLLNKELDQSIVDFIKLYLHFSELLQATTTFGEEFLKHVNPITGRIHTSYNQLVNTGRMSSRNPNNQNIPSSTEYRNCFVAKENFIFANADYSGQESIILVNKSMDKDLLAFYDNGLQDMHSYVAKLVFKKELAEIPLEDVKSKFPHLRQIAKSVGFALAYI